MKVRITKAPKFKKYQALTTSAQTESMLDDPFAADNQVTQPTTVDPAFQGNAAFPTAPGNIYGTGVQNPNQVNPIQTDLETNPATKVNSVQPPPSPTQKQKIGSEKIKSSSGNNLDKVMQLNAGKLALANFIDNTKKYNKKALTQRATESFHNSQPLNAPNKGTQGINSMNNFTPGMLSTIPSTGDFAAAPTMSMGAYGGQYMAYGGRVFNQVAPNALPDKTSAPLLAINKTLQPIPRDQANIEAEKDETIYFLNNGGLPAHYKIGGQPHSKGGTPLNVPEDSFVYSKALKIKDKNLFKFFDISKPTSFSDIAKKYDINKYRKILADPDTDKLQRDTAEKMIANYNLKLGMLALAQESTKGFPQGLPQVATPFTIVNAIDPEMILPTPPQSVRQRAAEQENPEEQAAEGYQEEPMMQPSMKFGGSMKVRIKSLPSYQSVTTPGQTSGTRRTSGAQMVSDLGYSTNDSNSDTTTQVKPKVTMQDGSVYDPNTGITTPPPSANNPNAASSSNANASANQNSTQGSDNFDIDVIEGNPDFWTEYNDLAKKKKIKPELAIGFNDPKVRQRQSGQIPRPGTKNVWGDRDIHKGELFDDFKKRQAWYFKDKPNWNVESVADVKDFQKKYCERAASFGMKSCYFNTDDVKDEKGRIIKGTTFDGFYGEHTFNAPGFNEADPVEEPETPQPPKDDTPQPDPDPIKVNPFVEPENIQPPGGFFPQDLINIGAVAGQRITVPKTWYAPLQFRGVDPAYLVPDYSPIMEAANIGIQGINAYGSRQSADASMSRIQGQSARAAADHNLAVANTNAGIYNNAQQINAQIANQNAMYNQQLAQTDFDANALYETERIKARNKKMQDLSRMVNAAITNRAAAETISDAYSDHFYIDPRRGGHIKFFKGSPFLPNENADMSDIEALDAQLTKLKYSPEDKKEILKAALASKYASKPNKGSYLPDYSQFTYPFNMSQDGQ